MRAGNEEKTQNEEIASQFTTLLNRLLESPDTREATMALLSYAEDHPEEAIKIMENILVAFHKGLAEAETKSERKPQSPRSSTTDSAPGQSIFRRNANPTGNVDNQQGKPSSQSPK